MTSCAYALYGRPVSSQSFVWDVSMFVWRQICLWAGTKKLMLDIHRFSPLFVFVTLLGSVRYPCETLVMWQLYSAHTRKQLPVNCLIKRKESETLGVILQEFASYALLVGISDGIIVQRRVLMTLCSGSTSWSCFLCFLFIAVILAINDSRNVSTTSRSSLDKAALSLFTKSRNNYQKRY